MIKSLYLLPLLLCSCGTMASKDRVDVRSNAAYVEWHGGNKPSLIMTDVDNGTPTRAAGSVVGTTGSSLMGIIMAYFTGGTSKAATR